MAETLLSYLTSRNPTVPAFARPTPTFTFNADWEAVEGIREWTDFNYDTLQLRFRDDLNSLVSKFDTTTACEKGGYNKIFDERGLSDLICMSITLPVSAALGPFFITSGARVTQHAGCLPDWSAGKDAPGAIDTKGRSKALVLGDTKFNWSSINAINVVQNMKHGSYEDSPLSDTVRPIEQVQHYGAVYGCRYVFILSDQELMVMRLHLAPDPVRTSPRPQRTRQLPSHQRVTSSSTISRQFTDMSLDETFFKARIGLIDYKKIPWSATSGLTIKLALYCLIRLAAEDGNDLKTEYPPLASMAIPSSAQHVPSIPLPPSSGSRNPISTKSPTDNTSQPSNENPNQYYDTTVIWGKDRTCYTYKNNKDQWVYNEESSKWRLIGKLIYRFHGSPPYARSNPP